MSKKKEIRFTVDLPMSPWKPLEENPDVPNEAALVVVRATKDGKPIPIDGPEAVDLNGTVYIKSCNDLRLFLHWLYLSLTRPNRLRDMLHPAAQAYFAIPDAKTLYPIEGLQYQYITESQIKALKPVSS